MEAIYILIILLCRVVQAVFNKRLSNGIRNISMFIGYASFQNAVSAALGLGLILLAEHGFNVNLPTVVISVFAGLTLFCAGLCSVYAMKSGTVSLDSMFGTAGMLVPILAGIFLFNKPITVFQWFGVALFFTAAWLLIGSSRKIYSTFSLKTLLFLIGSMLSNGGTMLAQQMFTIYVPNGDVTVFSFLSFGVVAVLGGVASATIFGKKRADESVQADKSVKNLVICGVALAAAIFIINQFVTLAAATMSPVVLFTFANSGGTVISALVAALIYNERLSKSSAAGVILGIISFVIIKMF